MITKLYTKGSQHESQKPILGGGGGSKGQGHEAEKQVCVDLQTVRNIDACCVHQLQLYPGFSPRI